MAFPSVYDIFINSNNTIYISNIGSNDTQVWREGNANATRIIAGNVSKPFSIFVTINDDIYVSNGPNSRVDRWLSNAPDSFPATRVYGDCYGLFIDISNTLYCSVGNYHFVASVAMGDTTNRLTLIAGQSCDGSTSDRLYEPRGIFVDFNYNLYVADFRNNRVQKFSPGQRNATTVAGWEAPLTIDLSLPTDVALDADGYLFIVNYYGNQIIGSGPNGFRCIISCSNYNVDRRRRSKAPRESSLQ